MTRPHNSCTGCIHWRGSGKFTLKTCNYLLDIGKMRGVPAEQCTHWEGEKKITKRRDAHKITLRYRELYDLGRSDADIARATGRSESSVLQWRRRNGLAAQGVPGRKTERMG
jgi:hypothetical protein